MVFCRAGAYRESRGNLGVFQALRQQLEYFDFARSQSIQRAGVGFGTLILLPDMI
jgi:hypothetical protein